MKEKTRKKCRKNCNIIDFLRQMVYYVYIKKHMENYMSKKIKSLETKINYYETDMINAVHDSNYIKHIDKVRTMWLTKR